MLARARGNLTWIAMRTEYFATPVPTVLIVTHAKRTRWIVKRVLQRVVGTLRSPVHFIPAHILASAAPMTLPGWYHPLRLMKGVQPTKAHARLAVNRLDPRHAILTMTLARINWMAFVTLTAYAVPIRIVSIAIHAKSTLLATSARKQIACGAVTV
jgi:hypothetical protein